MKIKIKKKIPIVKFSGSLIGQNYGESVDEHGILVWDLPNRSAEFVKIKNDYGFITFNVIDGNCSIPSNLPKNLRARIIYENSTNQQVEEFIKKLSKYCYCNLILLSIVSMFFNNEFD